MLFGLSEKIEASVIAGKVGDFLKEAGVNVQWTSWLKGLAQAIVAAGLTGAIPMSGAGGKCVWHYVQKSPLPDLPLEQPKAK